MGVGWERPGKKGNAAEAKSKENRGGGFGQERGKGPGHSEKGRGIFPDKQRRGWELTHVNGGKTKKPIGIFGEEIYSQKSKEQTGKTKVCEGRKKTLNRGRPRMDKERLRRCHGKYLQLA